MRASRLWIGHRSECFVILFLVEQNVPLALRVGDYAYVLHKGKIVHQCTKDELVGNERIQAEYIGVSKYGSS